MKTILRISEAVNELGICIKTIRRWDLAGLIDCFRTIGGHRRFLLVEIQRIREGRERSQIPAVPPFMLGSPHMTKNKKATFRDKLNRQGIFVT